LKKIIALIILWLPFSLLIGPNITQSQPQKVIRIAGDNQFPPFEYLTESGVYTGFNVDVMNAISIETGLKFEFYPMPWNQAIQALHEGKVDAIQGMKYSKERDKVYDFSDRYFTSTQAIFVRKDNLYIRQLKDLKHRTVIVQRGDIANELMQKEKNIKLIQVDTQQEAIQKLYAKKADAFVGNRITGQYLIQQSQWQNQIKIVGEPLHAEAYGVAVLPNNKRYLPLINEGLAAIKEKQTYQKIEEKWFGEYIPPVRYRLEKVLFLFQVGIVIIAMITLAILWWNHLLKKEVAKRTRQIEQINQKLEEKMTLLEENVFFQQQLLDSAYSCYIMLNRQGNVQMLNGRAKAFFNISDEILSLPYHETKIIDWIPAEKIQESLLKSKPFLQEEASRKNQVITYGIYPITTRSGTTEGIVINFHDITKRRALEKKAAESHRLRALGQMMMGIAHEIRNPLTAILTYTQLLPKKMDNLEFRQFFTQQVTDEIIRLNGLIDHLLDYARPKKSSPVAFSLPELIEDLLKLLKPKWHQKGIHVSLDFDSSSHVYADRQQIQQVLMNILINAIQAVSDKGCIQLSTTSEEETVKLQITDNGTGIDEQNLHKVFEPFFTSKPDGVGLGLSISYQLIRENKGAIEVHSTKGEGTQFTIQLPSVNTRKDEMHVSVSDHR
jgi:polar amino acid transport system substrate-binding protein